MSFWAVIFIVLMLFWLLCGGYTAYYPGQPGPALYGNAFIPWACVAILGYLVLTGQVVGPIVAR